MFPGHFCLVCLVESVTEKRVIRECLVEINQLQWFISTRWAITKASAAD